MNPTSTCRKESFRSQKDADFAAEKYAKTIKGKPIHRESYWCDKCKTWHLTSQYNKFLKEIERLKKEVDRLRPYEGLKGRIGVPESELSEILTKKNAEISRLKKQRTELEAKIHKINSLNNDLMYKVAHSQTVPTIKNKLLKAYSDLIEKFPKDSRQYYTEELKEIQELEKKIVDC